MPLQVLVMRDPPPIYSGGTQKERNGITREPATDDLKDAAAGTSHARPPSYSGGTQKERNGLTREPATDDPRDALQVPVMRDPPRRSVA